MNTEKTSKLTTNTIVGSIIATVGSAVLIFIFQEFWANRKERAKSDQPIVAVDGKLKNKFSKTINNYYADIKDKTFDARNYYADNVERFFQLKNTNPAAINESYRKYFKNEFLVQSISPRFETMDITKIDQSYIVEFVFDGTTYIRSKGKVKKGTYRERIKFDHDGRITYLHDYSIMNEAWVD